VTIRTEDTDRCADIAEDPHEFAGKSPLMVLASEEGDSLSALSSSAGTTATVHKVLCGTFHLQYQAKA
jgi:hypothetical protein